MSRIDYGGPTSDQLEREERHWLRDQEHWDDPANPDYADCSDDLTADPAYRVRLAKPTDRACRRRLPRRGRGFDTCAGRYLDGACDMCGGPWNPSWRQP